MQIIDPIRIEISPRDLSPALGPAAGRRNILAASERLLATAEDLWQPRAIIRVLEVERVTEDQVVLRSTDKAPEAVLSLGFAATFMSFAKQAQVAAYTIGDGLDLAVQMAAREKRYLDAYLYDLIGLTAMEKTGDLINRWVEQEAQNKGWKVGPFLSPGSVHGWSLDDQNQLCALLPLERIGVRIDTNGILTPLKSIACLIGLGPDYPSARVGSTCTVCSKRYDCRLRKPPSP